MKKIVIHSIVIDTSLQKEFFQIKLPQDTQQITGIRIEVSSFSESYKEMYFDAGVLSLWIPEKRNVFFSEYVKAPLVTPIFRGEKIQEVVGTIKGKPPVKEIIVSHTQNLNFYDQITYDLNFQPVVNFPISQNSNPWIGGKKETFFSIDVDIKNPLIEGYYEAIDDKITLKYQLNIYLITELPNHERVYRP